MRIDWARGTVSGAWDRPEGDPSATVTFAPGAGGDLNDSVLKAVARELSSASIAVLRFNFPYREAGRRAPGSQVESEDCYRDVASLARSGGTPLFCGGKSYGGRMASHIVADGFEVDGLIFISYPLHPPGRFDRLRDQHLAQIDVPMLFVQGTKDTFARPDLLESTLDALPRATHVPIDGGDHSLRVKGRPAPDVAREIAAAIASFVRAT
jgi:predicted alpha/beta-hydrolase family hydrolase